MDVNHRGNIIGEYNGLRVIDCGTCQFAHVDPLPSPESVRLRYVTTFYGADKPNYFKDEEEDAEWLKVWHALQLSMIERAVGEPLPWKQFLDVGCGSGHFLTTARAAGWNVSGIEPSMQAGQLARAQNLNVTQLFTEDERAFGGQYTVIRMAWVLEHIADPRAVLKKAVDALKPRGTLMVIVPNDFTRLQRAVCESLGKPQWWIHPTHINYFNSASLMRLLGQGFGLDVLDVATTYPMELFILQGEDYVDNDRVGKIAHGKRKEMELNLAKSDAGMRMLGILSQANNTIGRDVIVVGQKVG